MADEFLQAITADPLAAAAAFYAARLDENPTAVAFLRDELGLSLEQAARSKIGFSDRRLGKRLPSRDSQAGRDLRTMLIEIGLYKTSGHEALRGCLTIPLLDGAGKITGIHGRRIDRHGKGPQEVTVGEGEERLEAAGRRLEEEPALKAEASVGNGADCENADAADTDCEPSALQPIASGLLFIRDDRHYRVRGLEKNTSVCQLKVNLMASRDDLVHLDALDLVKARSRLSFIKAAAAELYVDEELVKKDIGTLLLKLEALREQQIAEAKSPRLKTVQLTQQEIDEALELLRDPDLLNRIVADMDACGMVGERTGKLVGYLAATSRKLAEPLAIVIQSSSSAGKTSLMDAVLAMMPEEEQLRYSAMTGQSLFYLASEAIRHKTLAISEDEGAAEAVYALKLLQSEGELRHATVARGSDGRMATQEYHVEGPVQIFLTTTAMEINEELVNRCLVLTVDESRDQTGAIQARQRESRTLDGHQASSQASQLRKLHQNAQRLLGPLRVFNPYAPQLTFTSDKTRLRRDHGKYLTLIEAIALLRQHQRPIHRTRLGDHEIEYINVERSDIAIANGIAGEVLGRSLDELSPQTRSCLMLTHRMVADRSKETGVAAGSFRFTRRDLREAIGWSDFQVRTHLNKLVQLEYVIIHRGKHGRRFVYELLYGGEGREGQPFLIGLLDPAQLRPPATTTTPSIHRPTPSIATAQVSPM